MGQWWLNIDFIYQSPVFKMLRCDSLSQIFCDHVSEIDLAHEWGSQQDFVAGAQSTEGKSFTLSGKPRWNVCWVRDKLVNKTV